MSEYSKEQLEQAYQFLQENSNGETFTHLIDTLEGTEQPLFTSTPEQKDDSKINVNNPSTVGVSDVSFELVPIVKGATTVNKVATELIEEAPVIQKGIKKVIDTANKIDDEVGRKVGIAKDNLEVPKQIKWVKDIGYGDIGDVSPALPPATAGGTIYNIYDNKDKIIDTVKEIFSDDNNSK